MALREVQSVNFYDAALSENNTLITSSKNGLLNIFYHSKVERDRLAFDMNSKKIKFYPDGDLLFTSSDKDGLRVWDREKEKIIFSYPQDEIFDHVYLQNRNIAALTEIGIKFYDLRMRYASTFHKQKRIKKIISSGEELLYCTNTTIYKHLNNKSIEKYKSDRKIVDFSSNTVLFEESLYFLDLEIEKQHKATKIVPLHSNYQNLDILVATIFENQLHFIEKKKDHSKTYEICKKIDHVISNKEKIYIFADNKLYIEE